MITKIEIPFDSELQEQEIHIPDGFEARIEDGKIILRKKLSEGEKVRAWLIDTIKQVPNDSIEWETIDKSSVLSWLEKQGKYETIWKPTKEQLEALEHFVRSVGESGYASPYDNNTKLLYSLLTDLKVLEKQGEQSSAKTCKDAWSEEDEDMLKKAIKLLDEFGGDRNACAYTLQEMSCRDCADWLKSLKQRLQ